MNHAGQASLTGYGCGGGSIYPDPAGLAQSIGSNAIRKPELASLAEQLENLIGRLGIATQRAGNAADRALGMEPEGAGPSGKASPPPNGLVQLLSFGLLQLGSVIESLEYHVTRLERL